MPMPVERFLAGIALCLVTLGAPLATAQPGTPALAVSDIPAANRAELAQVYLRLERALAEHPPAPERRANLERRFDAATLRFFGGGVAAVARDLDDLTLMLRFGDDVPAAAASAAALSIIVEPRVSTLDGGPARATVVPLYDMPAAEGAWVEVRDARHNLVRKQAIDRLPLSIELDSAGLAPGRYTLELLTGEGSRHLWRTAEWFIAAESPDAVRERVLAMLDEHQPETPALIQAVAACRARARLLASQPSATDSAQFLADPGVLAPQVKREAAAILRGEDPYAGRTGDWWQVVDLGGVELPCRIYVPAAAAQGKVMPLVIALHGAGGDENMFFQGYGAGRIVQLAEERGFMVAAPLTYTLMTSPRSFDTLLDALAMSHRVDLSRVYVVGHSLGAMTASGMAAQRATRIAAVACLAGGNFGRARNMAPTLVIAGELDPLIPAARLRTGVEAAAAAGLPVEFRLARNYGHTLLVGDHLESCMDWLLERQLVPRP